MSESSPYEPLNKEKKEVRVLYIEDFVSGQPYGYEEQCISGRLVHISLADEHLPYYALSYVWGDPAPVSAIVLSQGECIPIARNLFVALGEIQRNRFLPVGTPIWTDAVCINQKDVVEKSWQVAQMGALYSAAAKTLIYPGAPGVNSRQTMQFLNDVGGQVLETWKDSPRHAWQSIPIVYEIQKHVKQYDRIPEHFNIRKTIWKLWGRHRKRSALHQINTIMGSSSSISWNHMVDFLRLPWWKRVWVLQELMLSKSPCFVHGDQVVAAERVFASLLLMAQIQYYFISLYASHLPAPHTTLSDVTIIKWIGSGPDFEFYLRNVTNAPAVRLHTLQRAIISDPGAIPTGIEIWTLGSVLMHVRFHETPSMEATNPVDYIYALLGLVSSWPLHRAPLSPDYSLSPYEVYSQTAVLVLETRRLTTRTSLRPATLPKTLVGLASWVPDWSADWPDIDVMEFGIFDKVEQKVLYNMSPDGRHLLTISGSGYGCIQTLETLFNAFQTPNEDLVGSAEAIYQWLRSLYSFKPDISALPNSGIGLNQDMFVVLALSLCSRMVRDAYLAHLSPNPNIINGNNKSPVSGLRIQRLEALYTALRTAFNMKGYGKEPKIAPILHGYFESAVKEHYLENTIIQTDNGYIGLTRDTVREGDLLVQFDIDLGIHFIVRPQEDMYELVSMAYVPQLIRDPSIQGKRMEFTLC